MVGSCFFCDSVSLLMYRCSNPPCRKVFCRGCGTGWDHQACPACGNHSSENAGLVQAFVDILTPEPTPQAAPQATPQPHRSAVIHDDDGDGDDRVEHLETQIERLSEQLDRKGPPCPHCGGALAADAASKKFRLCPHCRLEVLWHRGTPFADQAGVDTSIENQRRREEAEENQRLEAKSRAKAKQTAAEAESRAAQDELAATLASLGLGAEQARCTLHTTLGPIVVDIHRAWSLQWAIWFAAGILQKAWDDAPIVQITPNCDSETGFFGGIKWGKRRGSFIHFTPSSVIRMPLTEEFLLSKPLRTFLKGMRSKESPDGAGGASGSSWMLHVFDKDTASPKIILHNAGPNQDTPTIGALDYSASQATLMRLEAAPIAGGDKPFPPLAVERIVLEGSGGGASPACQHISAGTCMHLAAVIAAVDGKLSQEEFKQVAATLVRIGVPEKQVKDRFITACKRVAQEGIDEWTEKLCGMLRSPEHTGPAMALTATDLTTLLQQLVTAGGGDTSEKQQILRRFLAAMRG